MEREEELRDFMAHLHEMQRVPAQEAVDASPYLLILGDPGSGKSTFVKHLAHTFAMAAPTADPAAALAGLSPWNHGWMLPARVELRYVAAYAARTKKPGDANLLRAFLHDQLCEARKEEVWTWLGEALDDPRQPVLLLLDGLDEAPREQRQVMVDLVHDWRRHNAHHRLVVTCRPYAYIGQPWRLRGFREVTLAPFSSAQIDRFVANWYTRLAGLSRLTAAKAKEGSKQLQEALRREDLHSLAERPLLLTVMAQLHSFTGSLPDDRTQLYAEAVNLLLLRWESRIGAGERTLVQQLDVPGLKLSDLEAGLFAVAFHAHEATPGADDTNGGDTADVDEAELCKWLRPYLGNSYDKAEQFVLYIRERAGLLIRRKSEAYTFPHRTFQEFLAACHLTGLLDYPREAAQLVRDDFDRWREVFVLAAGHAARTQRLGQAIAAVNALCPHDPPPANRAATDAAEWQRAELAGEALLEIGMVGVQREPAGQAVHSRVQAWLAQGIRRHELLAARERVTAGVTLAKLGDPRPTVLDPMQMKFCCVPAGPLRMGEGKEQYTHDLNYTYWVARFPITNAQYRAFVDAGGYQEPRWWAEATAAGYWKKGKATDWQKKRWRTEPVDYGEPFILPNHPVVGVTWYEALAFTRWLDEQYGRAGNLPAGLHINLPNEPEWEKAARGGLHMPAAALIRYGDALNAGAPPPVAQANRLPGRAYPWGDEPDPERANYSATAIGATNAVGCFAFGANPYGVEELAGNVWEWTRSLWVEKFPYRIEKSREDLAAGELKSRVLRGGAYYNEPGGVGCGVRYWTSPNLELQGSGFRVVLSPFTSGR